MRELILVGTLIGNLVTTSYRAVPAQTDDSPFYTATGEHVRAGGCAVSRDLLCAACRKKHCRCDRPDNAAKLHYGDWLYTEKYGYRQVNDVMAGYQTESIRGRKVRVPIMRHIDLFVWTWAQEHAVGTRTLDVFRVDARISNASHFDVRNSGTVHVGLR